MELRARLAGRTLELVNIPSESRDEGAVTAHLHAALSDGPLPVHDLGDGCLLAGALDAPVLLAGHTDTVPAQGNRPGSIDDAHVHGLGASDMKGGVGVLIELALAGAGDGRAAFLVFPREELPAADSALVPLLERHPLGAQLAIMLEPTSATVHAGCVGNVNATWTFRGRSGHAARPWLADNAIERAAAGIGHLAGQGPQRTTVEGLEFATVASVTRIAGGIADNVIPDEVVCGVNFRYAPDVAPGAAEDVLRAWTGGHGELEVTSNSASAPVATSSPLAQALIAAGDLEVHPKQAWTPVAEFAAAGIPALNFGPGDPAEAHRRDEKCAIDRLVEVHEVLARFLGDLA